MTPLLFILRASHCRNTHHWFAVDALRMIQTDAGKRLATLILRHYDRYLTGAKDPDTRFRDFQNHVVHVNDGYWGGAPRVAHQWYDRLQRYLRTNRFSDAAHAAGVLSHYFTDPLQPLHTQQCDRAELFHRPIEWSITNSYDKILRGWKDDDLRVVFQLSDRPGWLGEAMLHGARYANRKYGQLLDNFDLECSVKDPPTGLSAELRATLEELFGLAITGWARVLERAAADAEAIRADKLPHRSLSVPTLWATLCAPIRLWMRRVEFNAEQMAVARLFDEFRETGRLKDNLPAEVDIVHRVVGVYQNERRWKQEREQRVAAKLAVLNAPTAGDDSPATIPFVPRGSEPMPVRRSA